MSVVSLLTIHINLWNNLFFSRWLVKKIWLYKKKIIKSWAKGTIFALTKTGTWRKYSDKYSEERQLLFDII